MVSGTLVSDARRTTALPNAVLLPLVVVLISFFGMTDELHQLSTPGRRGADVYDWLADSLGAMIGACVTYARSRPGADPDDAVAARD